MRVVIDGLVFESDEEISRYKEHQMAELERKFAGALSHQPNGRASYLEEIAKKSDREKRADGWE